MTEVLDAKRPEALERAAALLRDGEVVGVPTETVYGLAGNALNEVAVAKIFVAKERPTFDPLIVHVGSKTDAEVVVESAALSQPPVPNLIARFWPGPLTLLLPKTERIPDIVTAGSDEVAVRCPSHPTIRSLLRMCDFPLAVPSANRFGRISPTSASAVQSELADRIPLILDGGATPVGIESTIIQVTGGAIQVLRPGPITVEMLAAFGPVREEATPKQGIVPGSLPSHYAPRRPLILVPSLEGIRDGARSGLLAWNHEPEDITFYAVRVLSPKADLTEAAANLFRFLRELDEQPIERIYAERVPELGIGKAIMNRLQRASGGAVQPR
jgi:L-threonylcarbamoyladenylate synthase